MKVPAGGRHTTAQNLRKLAKPHSAPDAHLRHMRRSSQESASLTIATNPSAGARTEGSSTKST